MKYATSLRHLASGRLSSDSAPNPYLIGEIGLRPTDRERMRGNGITVVVPG